MSARKAFFAGLFTLISALLVPSSRAASPPPINSHTVGGTITGLTGSRLILQNNGRDDLEINANGAFVFRATLAPETVFNVTVRQQPSGPAQSCTALDNTGIVGAVNVTTIVVECAAAVTSQVARFVYVSNADDTVSVYAVDAATNRLRPRGYARGTDLVATAIATDPSGRFAYTANQGSQGSGSLSAFRVDAASGALTPVPVTGAPFGQVTGVAVDPSGRFVYASQFSPNVFPPNNGFVTAYGIDQASGALTRLGATHFPTGTRAVAVAVEPTGRFVYVVNQGSNNVATFTIDQTSGLLAETSARTASPGGPRSIAVDPRGRYLYVTNANANTVSVFGIDQGTGALFPMGTPVAAGTSPVAVAIDSTGQLAYVANSGSNNISAYVVNPSSGSLTPVAGGPFPALSTPVGISIDPSGGSIRVAHSGSNEIATFAINPSTGALFQLTRDSIVRGRSGPSGITTLSGPSPVTFKPKFAYAGGGGRTAAFAIDPQTGALAPVAGSSFDTGGTPNAMATDMFGRFTYVARRNELRIGASRIDAGTGALTSIGPFATNKFPSDVTLDPSSRFLYVTSHGLNQPFPAPQVELFAVDNATGSLTAGGIFPINGLNTSGVRADPTGRFLYAANAFSNSIAAFAINSANGSLSAVSGSPFANGVGPWSISIEASGRYLYAANVGPDTISAYAIDANTGVLTAVPGSPFAAGGIDPSSIATDPFGRFAYVVNRTNLTAFRIDPDTGALIQVAGGSYPVAFASNVSVDESGRFVYVADSNSRNVAAFAIDALTGALTVVQGSPYSTGDVSPTAVLVTGALE